MRRSDVLVVTNEQDVGADFLVRELYGRGINVVRFNTERAPGWKLSVRPGSSWRFQGPTRQLSSEECVGIWWRRPEVPAPPASVGPAAEAIGDQWRAFLAALATVAGPVWVSDPADIRRAENKALQLRLASELGLPVPETLWSNDIDEVRALIEQWENAAVVKSVASAWWEAGTEGRFVFASEVTTQDLPEAASLAAAPLCIQRRVSPKRDVRVTVVGDAVFAAIRTNAPAGDTEPLDWRLGPQRSWASYELPPAIAAGCCELIHRLGLRFGAADLAVDGDGQHWFLELNPNGEWGWLQRAGLPVAEALADVLTCRA